MDDWGIEVTRAEILDVNLDDATRAAMLQQLNAERARRAQVTEAEGKSVRWNWPLMRNYEAEQIAKNTPHSGRSRSVCNIRCCPSHCRKRD